MKTIQFKSLLIIVVSLVVMSCNTAKENEIQVPKKQIIENETSVQLTVKQFEIAEIELGKVEQKSLSNVLKVNGIMSAPPQNLISISAPLGGFVFSTDLLLGMPIKKGQILAVLEHADYVQLQQDYVDKKSQLEFLKLEFNRQKELFDKKANSAKVFQKAKSKYKSMQAQIKGLEEKLALISIDASTLNTSNISRKINIYAPISGYVSQVNVNIGRYVTPNQIMFEIIDTKHLHAELTVYEKDVVKLKVGQPIRFTLPNENDSERQATVYLIGRKIDANRSVRVHAHLKNEDTELLPGMYITAQIELNENKVNAVPEKAVVLSEGKNYVYILKEKQNDTYFFEMIEIQKGITESGFTEISSTTSINNTQLVTKGAFTLLSKMKNIEEE